MKNPKKGNRKKSIIKKSFSQLQKTELVLKVEDVYLEKSHWERRYHAFPVI